MEVFEVVIALLLGGAALAAVARRLGVPYPALVALAGAALALIPGVPTLVLDPAANPTDGDRHGVVCKGRSPWFQCSVAPSVSLRAHRVYASKTTDGILCAPNMSSEHGSFPESLYAG